MIFQAPPFFQNFELDAEADERMIKRVYAKALKQIDQESQLEAFQSLRESYEAALAWFHSRDWRLAQIAARELADDKVEMISGHVEAKELADSPAITDSQNQVAVEHTVMQHEEISNTSADNSIVHEPDDLPTQNEVVKLGEVRIDRLRGEQVLSAADVARASLNDLLMRVAAKENESGTAERELLRSLEGEGLINVEARDIFEYYLAAHLSLGWQPGNGDLFGAAVKCFGWNYDKKRLMRFSEFGYYLDRAVDELSAFNQQEANVGDRLIRLIRRGRENEVPNKQYLRENIRSIDNLLESYPNWIALVTNCENFNAWQNLADDYHLSRTPLVEKTVDNSGSSNWFSGWGGRAIWILLIVVIRMCSVSDHQNSNSNSQSNRPGYKVTNINFDDPEYLFRKGEEYFTGANGTPIEIPLAEINWKRAAEQGSQGAQRRLAALYENDEYGRKNLEESQRYYTLAIEGDKKSATVVGFSDLKSPAVAK